MTKHDGAWTRGCSMLAAICLAACGSSPDPGPDAAVDGAVDMDGAVDRDGAVDMDAAVPVCGDGRVEGTETCDDDNVTGADGCSTTCAVEPGFACTGAPSLCTTVCGDGLVRGDEACDDDDTDGADGCSAACVIEPGFSCAGEPSTCGANCGDGMVVGTETCDDGASDPGDGCSAGCVIETGHDCTGMPSSCMTVCGDGLIVGAEACDDDGESSGDGCSSTCTLELGFDCGGEPTMCVPTCGDGLVRGTETCDDDEIAPDDGCSPTCVEEAGFDCTGEPSVCVTTCGDGFRAGAEACDDGNPHDGDDCRADCTDNLGESCLDPLGASRGTTVDGRTTWTLPAGALTVSDGVYACDPSGVGADAVFRVVKTSATLAMGGRLLHVGAATGDPGTSAFLTVEVTSGACSGVSAESERCLWYNPDWEAFLDVPPGQYFVHVARNTASVAGTPALTVFAEEIAATDPAAEGEGCFAPYTSASAIHTVDGSADVWTIPAGIESFDMGPTWGEPQSISCDDTAPYGDIHGADAVIAYDKASASSVLFVEVQNLDPVPSSSDLNVEVLATCDPLAMPRVSRNCRANADTIAFTAGGPAGLGYIWLSTEATAEEFAGAQVRVTELALAPGDSWVVAEPLVGSGPIAPSSTERFDAPSCFTAPGDIHWYAYTLVRDALTVRTNAGPIALIDGSGRTIGCSGAGSVGVVSAPGTTFYVAVMVGTTTSLTIGDLDYEGVRGVATDLDITFPSSPATDFGMTSGPGALYLGGTGAVFEIPLASGATAVEHSAADGLTATHLGYDLVHTGTALFSVDSTVSTVASRLFRIASGSVWGPTAWDLTPTYTAASPTHALAYDGTAVLYATRRTTASTDLYSLSPGAAAVPTLLGTNTSVWYVTGLAADATYFYVASDGASGEGVYRIARANVAAAAMFIAPLDTGVLHNAIAVDRLDTAGYLYARDGLGDIHAVIAPAGATPSAVGVISTLGGSADFGMVFDRTLGALFAFETETDGAGRIVRLD